MTVRSDAEQNEPVIMGRERISNIDLRTNGAAHSQIPGFTALGYVNYGTDRGGRLRKPVKIDEAGVYRMSIRYLAPDDDIDRINVSINGSVAKRNIKFEKTGEGNAWAECEFEIDLNEGISEILLSSTKAQTSPFYLDNFTLTPLAVDAVSNLIDEATSFGDGVAYDILGRQVYLERLKKGEIYILNGKKYVVK